MNTEKQTRHIEAFPHEPPSDGIFNMPCFHKKLLFCFRRLIILSVAHILYRPKRFTEALVVNNFAFTQEANRCYNIGIIRKPQNVVISCARFLLCCNYVRTTSPKALENTGFFVDNGFSPCNLARTTKQCFLLLLHKAFHFFDLA